MWYCNKYVYFIAPAAAAPAAKEEKKEEKKKEESEEEDDDMGFGMLLTISKNLHTNLTIFFFHCRFVRLKGIQSTSVLCQVMGQFCVLCKYIRSSINLSCFVVWFLSKMVCSYLNIELMVVRRFSMTGSWIRVF
jgi:hypothetical protein